MAIAGRKGHLALVDVKNLSLIKEIQVGDSFFSLLRNYLIIKRSTPVSSVAIHVNALNLGHTGHPLHHKMNKLTFPLCIDYKCIVNSFCHFCSLL